MKKILEKIVAISLTVIGLLLIALLIVVMLNAIDVQELDNQLVKVLIISLSVVFAVLAGIIIAMSFSDSDRLNSIILFKDKESATKATVSVVKKMVRKASKRVEEAKVTKVSMFGDENNNVKLAINLKINSNKTEEIIDRIRGEIMTTCSKILLYDFSSIDFKVVKLKTDYVPSSEEIEKTIAEYRKANELAKEEDTAAAEEEKAVAMEEKAENIIAEEITEEKEEEIKEESIAEEKPVAEEPKAEVSGEEKTEK